MLRSSLFFGIVVAVILIATGVLEVKFHPDRLVDIPGRLTTIVQDGDFVERGRAQAVWWKRLAEQRLVGDDARRLELAWLYVKTDAERLKTMLEKYQDQPEKLLPQASLLVKSLELGRTREHGLSSEKLQQLSHKKEEALAVVSEIAGGLQNSQNKQAVIQEKFGQVTSALSGWLSKGINQNIEAPQISSPSTPRPLNF